MVTGWDFSHKCDPCFDALGNKTLSSMVKVNTSLWQNNGAGREQDRSQSPQNSNTISQPAAAEGNPGHLMYSHTLHLTQWLSTGSYQHPTDMHANLDVCVFKQRSTRSLWKPAPLVSAPLIKIPPSAYTFKIASTHREKPFHERYNDEFPKNILSIGRLSTPGDE